MKHFAFLIALLMAPVATIAQIQEPPKNGLSKEDYIVMLIDSLGIAESNKDTLNVIRYASVLTTSMHGSKIRKRSRSYLDIALSYSSAFSDKRWYPEVCNRAGMYHFASRNSEDFGSEQYSLKNDSSIYWHKKAIELGKIISNPITQGWGHRGAMSVFIDMHTKGLGNYSNEITYHFTETERISNTFGDNELFIHSAQRYCSFLTYENRIEDISMILVHLVPAMQEMSVAQSLAYFHTLHDFIAIKNDLDTLVAINKELFIKYDQTVAANHQGKLHEADQKYEVSKTKGVLASTQEELQYSRLILTVSVGGLLLIFIILVYFYSLNKKNKRLSSRNELLLKEQNHRVKNNLQMINSLLSLQSQKLLSTDAKEALSESQNRINSVALLHRMLYEGDELGVINTKQYLNNLIEELSYTSHRTITWAINIDPLIQVSVEKATSLGLIINELITNSIKHVNNTITLEVQLEIRKVLGDVEVIYQDNGQAFDIVQWESSDSFGNQLIKLQSEQLRGTYNVISNDGFQYFLKLSA